MHSTNPPAPPAPPVNRAGWIELGGTAALDPEQAARAERWLAELFGEEDDFAADPALH